VGAFIMGKDSPKAYNYTKNDLANVLNQDVGPQQSTAGGLCIARNN
jgi:hypothetical protein